MTNVPTYEDLSKMKNENAKKEMQMAQSQNMQQNLNIESEGSKNPLLEEYIKREQQSQPPQFQQQGLGPRPEDQYTMFATNVADSVGSQEEYSKIMVDSAMRGKINPEIMFSDPSVLENDKKVLMSLISGGPKEDNVQGLGKIR